MPTSAGGVVVKVVEAACTVGLVSGTGNVAFGSWFSTFMFNRLTSFIRSSLRLSSPINYTLLLTSAS
ncbi:hypothetical protein [Mycobacterium lepromatosis]|uniref:hypothetical protein n=1 Tax=Mycobacterium lepromatosis TaxID=480418 RepID=UPI0005F874E7|nr:hypothetical protein [Mycobacterium lepromatosis]